jgi:hypothetical protein
MHCTPAHTCRASSPCRWPSPSGVRRRGAIARSSVDTDPTALGTSSLPARRIRTRLGSHIPWAGVPVEVELAPWSKPDRGRRATPGAAPRCSPATCTEAPRLSTTSPTRSTRLRIGSDVRRPELRLPVRASAAGAMSARAIPAPVGGHRPSDEQHAGAGRDPVPRAGTGAGARARSPSRHVRAPRTSPSAFVRRQYALRRRHELGVRPVGTAVGDRRHAVSPNFVLMSPGSITDTHANGLTS